MSKIKTPIMISACLLGMRCRYDGEHSLCPALQDFIENVSFIPFCPEQLGGLSTPRPPSNITGGDGYDVISGKAVLINMQGQDVTYAFKKGAEDSLKLSRLARSTISIMKDRSPSCGIRTPYCDKLSGFGIGVTAALFELNGIKTYELRSDDPFPTPDFLELLNEIN
ncbi:MAG TPA: DUF523 domain-containing protein [Desulfobacteraceae bacterium]|nr:DUF523 domain-containing protein [Desulfobacteraceae bacterium]HPQ29303.1 DUF523 domain-containing protein [Desulfobacteraceae bacterium]